MSVAGTLQLGRLKQRGASGLAGRVRNRKCEFCSVKEGWELGDREKAEGGGGA